MQNNTMADERGSDLAHVVWFKDECKNCGECLVAALKTPGNISFKYWSCYPSEQAEGDDATTPPTSTIPQLEQLCRPSHSDLDVGMEAERWSDSQKAGSVKT